MDPKHEFDLDGTMDSKSRNRLRSSLKKGKSRNPLGPLDITDFNADITLVPPPRRVSFAASNYVKPFMDDPEKNTIWDNTYEEEVNHTDSTKSEHTNPTDLSEMNSNYQKIANLNYPESIPVIVHNKDDEPSMYSDQSMVDMEFTCFNQTLINEQIRNTSSESLDVTCTFPNIDIKNNTGSPKETSLDMEFTCQWKNKPILAQKENTINKNHLQRNSTVIQEEDMSMTCCFGSVANQESKVIPAELAECSEMCIKEENRLLPRQHESEMEFTCTFPNNILETVNQHKPVESHFLITDLSQNVQNRENMLLPGEHTGWLPHQSEMEFKGVFSNKILANQPKETSSNFLAEKAANKIVENKEHLLSVNTPKTFPIVDNNKEKNISADQSGMEFTCIFPSKSIETTHQSKNAINNFLASRTVNENIENKENLLSRNLPESCPVVNDKNETSPNQSTMEFTCVFPTKILESETANRSKYFINNSLALKTAKEKVEDKENLLSDKFQGSFPMVNSKKVKVFLPRQSGMDFSSAFPNKTLETLNQSKKTVNSSLAGKTVIKNVENTSLPSNLTGSFSTFNAKKEIVILPHQSKMEFTYLLPNETLVNQSKEIECDHLSMTAVNVENTENILLPVDFPTVQCKKENVLLSHQSEMEISCTIQNKTLGIANQCQPTENIFLLQTRVNESETEFTSQQLDQNEMAGTEKLNKSNEKIILKHSNLKSDTDICSSSNTYTTSIKDISKFKSSQELIDENIESEQMKPIFVEPKINTNIDKAIKVREFGNIAVAMDITDLSIDQNINDNAKDTPDFIRRDSDLKEKTNTVNKEHPVKNSIQLKQNDLIGCYGKNDYINQGAIIDSQYDLISLKTSFDKIKKNIVDKNIPAGDNHAKIADSANILQDENSESVIKRKQDLPVMKRPFKSSFPEELQPMDFVKKEKSTNTTLVDLNNQSEENIGCSITKNNVSNQSVITEQGNHKISVTEGCMIEDPIINSIANEVCTLDEEECSLITSEEECASLEGSFSQNGAQDVSASKEDRSDSMGDQDLQRDEKTSKKKVIYSEPMKAFNSEEFPSMQTSGMNPFNFNSTASIEETQQLIQTTFSKPSFLKTDQFENNKCSSGFLPGADMSQGKEANEFNKTDTIGLQNETLKAQSILQNIENTLVRGKFQKFNCKKIADSIQTNRELCNKMENLLLNFKLSGERNLDFLVNQLPDLLENMPLAYRIIVWFLQDGAPPHFVVNIRDHLNLNFGRRWIGRGGPIACDRIRSQEYFYVSALTGGGDHEYSHMGHLL